MDIGSFGFVWFCGWTEQQNPKKLVFQVFNRYLENHSKNFLRILTATQYVHFSIVC